MASSVTLYEGNFSEWRAFISQRLSARGYSNVLATFGKAPSTVTPRNYLRYKQIANSMLKTVHTSLRERVKGKDARVPWLLLEALQKIARPSRFMDLPPELRENVYDFLPDH
ncbi:hypothetical protein CLAFUW4_08424 [Fulvia fulva]|uniref:Uncharacterized protein n=1 Tax=Passalora fulva TaxID=5499 RepID=A0A9Q8P6L3_PASFU|nr:uncharacterized protein CLAFUR5_08528 [Fulvia fulva]KAK4629390.1 hypothetical protein CLAFUR4_08429 [Fulvia fulva]KAK4630140.1 hypothetical protein CLAFUR0_08424 [Fulvia fulva]UJO15076.1 hypothetical protein CLAFUR5_08528 [Fulvia fulva]WPV12504.1 hypothetical protein CLAFUW4_08424 [Fulvia fulva]WPV27389.1 hypothetical protein CLAFUW7_08424 [Fulvia fulva]